MSVEINLWLQEALENTALVMAREQVRVGIAEGRYERGTYACTPDSTSKHEPWRPTADRPSFRFLVEAPEYRADDLTIPLSAVLRRFLEAP